MDYVICRKDGGSDTRLTIGKIYEVVYTNTSYTAVSIIDDIGEEASYFLRSINGMIWFDDAKDIIRNNRLDEILNG